MFCAPFYEAKARILERYQACHVTEQLIISSMNLWLADHITGIQNLDSDLLAKVTTYTRQMSGTFLRPLDQVDCKETLFFAWQWL